MKPSFRLILKLIGTGKCSHDFLEEFNLFISNTSFMKPKGQLWTFGQQLDYLIFRKKWQIVSKIRETFLPLALLVLTIELFHLWSSVI